MTAMNDEARADPGCPKPGGCSEHGCHGACLPDDEPKCDRCGAPITTGMMALMCPHGRQCAMVDDDDHWQQVEEFRADLGIERVKLPNTRVTGPA